MDAKKAIEYLTLTKIESRGYEGKNYDEVIELIEELEKYKQMWEEYKITRGSNAASFMEDFEQKYFPEPIKETFTFTIEAQGLKQFKEAVNDFDKFWADYNAVKGHNIKYNINLNEE